MVQGRGRSGQIGRCIRYQSGTTVRAHNRARRSGEPAATESCSPARAAASARKPRRASKIHTTPGSLCQPGRRHPRGAPWRSVLGRDNWPAPPRTLPAVRHRPPATLSRHGAPKNPGSPARVISDKIIILAASAGAHAGAGSPGAARGAPGSGAWRLSSSAMVLLLTLILADSSRTIHGLRQLRGPVCGLDRRLRG